MSLNGSLNDFGKIKPIKCLFKAKKVLQSNLRYRVLCDFITQVFCEAICDMESVYKSLGSVW